MCGIVGIWDSRGVRPIERDALVRMNQSQHHRGPDETGLHLAPGVGLGHKRLSIIDLATGQQPLFNEDGSVVVVYNGEIYNYGELIPELTALGHVFRTRSDTEVIVHAWEAWGEACVDRFRGMFAFALWDERQQTLFLARDRLGVKPLFYAQLPAQAAAQTRFRELTAPSQLPIRPTRNLCFSFTLLSRSATTIHIGVGDSLFYIECGSDVVHNGIGPEFKRRLKYEEDSLPISTILLPAASSARINSCKRLGNFSTALIFSSGIIVSQLQRKGNSMSPFSGR